MWTSSFCTTSVKHVLNLSPSQPWTLMRSRPTYRPVDPVLWVRWRGSWKCSVQVSRLQMTRPCQSDSWWCDGASLCCWCSSSSLLESSSASCSSDCSNKMSDHYKHETALRLWEYAWIVVFSSTARHADKMCSHAWTDTYNQENNI